MFSLEGPQERYIKVGVSDIDLGSFDWSGNNTDESLFQNI